MNPFFEKTNTIFDLYQNWKQLYPKPYNKFEVSPYSKCRILLSIALSNQSNLLSHHISLQINNIDLKKELALLRTIEKQQQLKISLLKPPNESNLEHTINYEFSAVEISSCLSKIQTDGYVKDTLNFLLVEDLDHLYRFSNLLQISQGLFAEDILSCNTEIIPARPTISQHRYPKDNIRRSLDFKICDNLTTLTIILMTGLKKQTLNYYSTVANLAQNDISRRLYEEIALIEESHVTQYETLWDSTLSPLEKLLFNQYAQCYLCWSNYQTETNNEIKLLWEENLQIEITKLNHVAKLLTQFEDKSWSNIIQNGEFPPCIDFCDNTYYVRNILPDYINLTSFNQDYININNLPSNAEFYKYQNKISPSADMVPSHNLIEAHIWCYGKDYRYEVAPHPIQSHKNRNQDNTDLGRKP